MPRTTLFLEDDAAEVARAHAERHHITLGEAVSELVRQAAEHPLLTESRNGLQVARVSPRSPKITANLVDRLRDELP